MTTQTSDSDDGTTLVELLVVTVIMGIVATVLAFSFVAVVKASPSTEARTDDARTLLGLTTYLPEDVNSTPSTGYDLAKAAVTGCSGASPGVSLVHLTWTETTGSTTTFRVNYRYVDDGNGYKIVRYSCLGGGAPNQLRMTSQLPDINELTWIPGSTPVNVQTTTNGTEITGLTVQVTTIAGDALTLEMRTNNPADTLPPTPPIIFPPPPPGNVAPTAGDVSSTTFPNTPVDVALDGDDVDGDVLVATWSNVTPNWSVSVTGLTATVTPDPLAIEPTVGTFNYTVRDPYGQTSASALVTVTLVAAPINGPPDAPDVVASIEEGTPTPIPLLVSDPDGNPLTNTVVGATDPSLTMVSIAGNIMTVTSDGTTATPSAITYQTSDGSLTDTGTVTLTVTLCTVSSLTPVNSSIARRSGNKRLVSDVTYTVAYTGPCTDLVLEYDNDLSNGYNPIFLSFGSGTTVTLDGHPGGLTPWSLGAHTLSLRDGASGPVLLTATLTVTS